MSYSPVSLAVARDVLLVLATAVLVVALGAAAAGVGIAVVTRAQAAAVLAGEVAIGPSGSDRLSPAPPRGSAHLTISPRQRPAAEPPRVSAAANAGLTASPGAATPGERFSGEGAGRQERVILRDPHNRRSYILETASLLHRRGWIGLESPVAGAPKGEDAPRHPPAPSTLE